MKFDIKRHPCANQSFKKCGKILQVHGSKLSVKPFNGNGCHKSLVHWDLSEQPGVAPSKPSQLLVLWLRSQWEPHPGHFSCRRPGVATSATAFLGLACGEHLETLTSHQHHQANSKGCCRAKDSAKVVFLVEIEEDQVAIVCITA